MSIKEIVAKHLRLVTEISEIELELFKIKIGEKR